VAVIALMSGKGSPGVTTAALAMTLAWPQTVEPTNSTSSHTARPTTADEPTRSTSGVSSVVMVDADPAGCGTGPGFFRGAVPEGAGLTALLASTGMSNSGVDLLATAVALDATQRRLLVPGFADAAQAATPTSIWPLLSQALAETAGDDVDVLVDVGRLDSANAPAPLLDAADLIAVVARSSLASVAGARSAIRRLRQLPGRRAGAPLVQVLLVGSGRPHSVREIEASLGMPVAATLAWDPGPAQTLSDGASAGWLFWRSPLMRSVRVAAGRLTSLAPSTSGPAEAAKVSAADATGAAVGSWRGRRARVRPASDDQHASVRSGAVDE
jgi:hypothetical protein